MAEEQPVYTEKPCDLGALEDLLSYFTPRKRWNRAGAVDGERLQQAFDHMPQHFREEITLEDLADHLYSSRAYISTELSTAFRCIISGVRDSGARSACVQENATAAQR